MTDSDMMDEDEVERRDPNDPGEVKTGFSTVGQGWSGRDEEEEDPAT